MRAKQSVLLGMACLVGLTAGSASHAAAPPFVLMWGSYGTSPGQFRGPTGIAIDGNENVFVSQVDNVYRAQKFTSSGGFLTLWGSQGSGPGQLDFPHDIAVDGSGNVYIADSLNDRIQKFNNNGSYISQWGSYGSGAGQFDLPYGVAVDGSGNVFVLERGGGRVQKFTSSGSYITSFGSFNQPLGIGIDGAGNVYVADTGNNKVQKFSNSGGSLGSFGSSGSGNGQFSAPTDVTVDGDGNIYVTDTNNHRVQVFTSNFSYSSQWGGFGFTAGFFLSPSGVEVSGDGYVYVVDGGNARIQKFGPVAPAGGGGQEPNTPAGNNVLVSLDPDTELLYSQVTSEGNSTLAHLTTGPTPPNGFMNVPAGPPRYYELDTSASFNGQVEVSINYNPADVQGAESDLRIYHYNESRNPPVWEDITTNVRTGPNIIEGISTSLSTFIVAEAAAPTGIADGIGIPTIAQLSSSFPNPFRQSTSIRFGMAESGPARLQVFDLHGRQVNTLVDTGSLPAGYHDVAWDGRDHGGKRLSPGVYFYRLQTRNGLISQKVMLID